MQIKLNDSSLSHTCSELESDWSHGKFSFKSYPYERFDTRIRRIIVFKQIWSISVSIIHIHIFGSINKNIIYFFSIFNLLNNLTPGILHDNLHYRFTKKQIDEILPQVRVSNDRIFKDLIFTLSDYTSIARRIRN